MTLLEKLDRLPPAFARLFAKHERHLASDDEMMRRTGWGETKLRRISRADSWRGVAVADVDCFLKACGLTWSAQRRQRWLLKLAANGTGLERMRHLRHKKFWQACQVQKHIRRLKRIFDK